MDIGFLIRVVCAVTFSLAQVGSAEDITSWLMDAARMARGEQVRLGRSSRTQLSANTVEKDTETDEKNTKKCCENGGVCVLGSFCHCPKNFYGRRCEHELLYRSCGPAIHGSWVRSECNFCRCFDGNMVCVPQIFTGCEEKNEKPIDPFSDKKVIIDAPEPDYNYHKDYEYGYDGDDYIDYYNEDHEDETSGSGSLSPVTAVFWMCSIGLILTRASSS